VSGTDNSSQSAAAAGQNATDNNAAASDQNAANAGQTGADNGAAAANDNTQTAQNKAAGNLPQTASPLPLLGLLGFGSLAAGLVTRRRK
jgi:LPXTG-motif cell wall-anchored protein